MPVWSASAVTVLLLTILALAVRLNGLDWRDGDLSTDEARLVLAANGVLATGLPILPSDRLYTRGLVTIYATAPSLALFGVHDWSARLPGIVAGALLVPAVFLLARGRRRDGAGPGRRRLRGRRRRRWWRGRGRPGRRRRSCCCSR